MRMWFGFDGERTSAKARSRSDSEKPVRMETGVDNLRLEKAARLRLQ